MLGIFSFVKDIGNYEDRKVARTNHEDNKGIGVSTAYSSDEGYETALLDKNGVHPVERYENKSDAEIGHKKWVSKSKRIKTVIKLGGFGGLVDNKRIVLKRYKYKP